MIVVEHLTRRFGRVKAVDDLSFEVEAGEAVALWGPNGAGKTTAIRCILGLLRGEGRITVAGHDVRRRGKAARRMIGYVPQELSLHDDFTAIEAAHFYARLKRVGRDRPGAVLADVGLAPHARKRVRQLSGGMKQRLALAIAMLADPPLLLLDELTSNLDAEWRVGFLSLLKAQKERGKSILFTSHRCDEVESLADRVLVLESGRLRCECPAAELAETLGLESVLRIFVAKDEIARAVETLRGRGLAASPNGAGLHVTVAPRQKALAIQALSESSIHVRDFEIFGESSIDRRKEHSDG